MANLKVKDQAGDLKHLKKTGAGTDGDPFVDPVETAIGEVQASPTSNTVLDRLKALLTGIVLAAGTNLIGKVTVRNSADSADIDPLADSTYTGRVGEVQASPTANTVLGRLKDLLTNIVLAAGENHIGSVAGNTAVVEASITRPADTNDYASGDAVTDSTSSPNDTEFSGCARVNDGSGVILTVQLIDSVNASPSDFDLILFDTAPTPTNDNAAFALTDADAENILPGGTISFTSADDGVDLGANNYTYTKTGLNIPFECNGTSTKLYGLLVVRGAYSPASAEKFSIRLGISQD